MLSRYLFFIAVMFALSLSGCSSDKSATTPAYAPTDFDCSSVQSLQPDSSEAQRIVEEFIANYQQDFPTEYMAIEELWAVDKLEDYAVVQGRVTQEENDIIIVQKTKRGFVMAARYHTHMALPEPRRTTIPQYFIEQLPDAPPELFRCLDLSRYIGESNP